MSSAYPRAPQPGDPVQVQLIAPGVANYCQLCRAPGPAVFVRFDRHTGMVVMFQHAHVKGYMCRDCFKKQFNRCFWHTAGLGWWGMISCVATPVTLVYNLVQLPKLKKITAPPPMGAA